MLTRIGTSAMAALLAATLLAGCSSTQSAEPSAEPTTGPSPTSTPGATPTATAAPTPVAPAPKDVLAAFRTIADASCGLANRGGVVESTADGTASNILVPKKFAYQDFNAVAVSDDDGASLIWSLEDFIVCNASVGFAMTADSGGSYKLKVTYSEADGTYSTVYKASANLTINNRYVVHDGIIVGAFVGPKGNELEMTVTYGMPTDEHVAILHTAVDAFLAED